MKNYVDKEKLQEYSTKLTNKYKTIFATKAEIGSPLVASTVAEMTDESRIYVYTGSETGYTAGDWYYWDGSAWISGGVYNSVAVDLDSTLSIPGKAADAKAVGDAIADAEIEIDTTLTQENKAAEAKATGNKIATVFQLISSTEKSAMNNSLLNMPFDRYMNVSKSELQTLLSDAEHPFPYALNGTSYIVTMVKWSTQYKRCSIERTTGNEHYIGLTAANHMEYFTWYDVSYNTLNNEISEINTEISTINTEVNKLNQELTSAEISALNNLLDVPANRYFWANGNTIATLAGANFPFTLSNIRYMVQSWLYTGSYKVIEITRGNGKECYRGMTAALHPTSFDWYDNSYVALENKIDSAVVPNLKHFTLSNFEKDGHWYKLDGTTYASGSTVKTAPIKIQPGRTYYSAWATEDASSATVCCGAWLREDKSFLSPIRILSPYREINGISKINYVTGSLCVKDGQCYEAKENIGSTGWDANKWEAINTPNGCAEIINYELPEAGVAATHRWWAADSRTAGLQYANLYSLTAPEDAAYIVLNLRSTVSDADYDTTNVQYISTMPLFAVTGYPNQSWSETDTEHSKWQDKNLCVIGQSGVMVGRLLRLLPNNEDSNHYKPLVGFQEYLIPFFKSVTTYGYSGRNYMISSGSSIYDQIITAEKDLSNFDFFLLTLGGNELSYSAAENYKIGVYDSTDPATMCGGLNALIDYILNQTKIHDEPPRIYIDCVPFGPNHYSSQAALNRYTYMHEEVQRLCSYRQVNFIDRFTLSDFTTIADMNSPTGRTMFDGKRLYYDGTHNNDYGNRIRAEIYRKAIVGI